MQFRGTLYRGYKPKRARQPLSGKGAALHGGRFNKLGVECLYTSTSYETALLEVNQFGGFSPVTLVAFEANIDNLFDATSDAALDAYNATRPDEVSVTLGMLGSPDWRSQQKMDGISASQEFADELIQLGYHGIMVPSFERRATSKDINIALWNWTSPPHAILRVIDPEERLNF